MAEWSAYIEHLELSQRRYHLECDDRHIAYLTQEQYESFKHILERIKELEEVLIEYGSHQPGCARQWGSEYACRCGWTREKEKTLKDK